MGKGKAETDYWAARVKPGTVLYEIAGVPEELAKQAFARIAQKNAGSLPIRRSPAGRLIPGAS
jgi:large subunit ribosomal protein L16